MKKLEKFLFYALIFFASLQLRIIIRSFRPDFNEWTSAYFYATDILILGLLLLWLAEVLREKKWAELNLKKVWTEVGIFLFLIVSGASVFLSDNFGLSFYGWLKLVELGLLFLYIKYHFSEINLKKFWQIFVAGCVFQGLIGLWQFYSQKNLGLKMLAESRLGADVAGVAKIVVDGKKIIRAYGLVPHPNILAATLMIAIFGLAYIFIKNYNQIKKWEKTVYASALVLICAALFFTFSRVVTLIGLFFLILWLIVIYLRHKEFRRPVVFFTVLLLVIGSVLLAIFWPYVSARYDMAGFGKSQSFNLRVFYNQIALEIIKGSPFLGIGQDNFVWTFAKPEIFENWVYQPVHNIYLLIAAETGILGLFAFSWFLFKIARSIYLARKSVKDKLILLNFIAIAIFLLAIGFFDHFLWDLQQGQLMLWVFLGIVAGLSPYSSTDRARPSEG